MIYNGSQGLRPDPNGNIEQFGRADGRENTESDDSAPQKRVAGLGPAGASSTGAAEKRIVTDGGVDAVGLDDLLDFRRDILLVLGRHGPQYGLAIIRHLNDLYGYDADEPGEGVNHGRLYPNLDALAEMGLVNKSDLDNRTNQYELTGAGREWVRRHAQRWVGAADGGESGGAE